MSHNFSADASWVNGSTPYYDLTAPLKGTALQTTNFSCESLQYNGRDTVFLPNNTLIPSSGYSLESTKYAGDSSYFNTYGGGTPPAFPPTTPDTAGAITTTSINMYFSSQGSSGDPLATYSFLYGTTPNPTTPFPSTLAFGSLYTGTFTGLTPSTTYYFVAVASNPSGTLLSQVSAGITTASPVPSPTPPSGPPTIPTLVSATTTSITIQFNVAGISGNPTPTFFGRLASTPLPSTNVGSIYQATASGLTPNTPYSFTSVAQNSSGTQNSASVSFSTLPNPPPSVLTTTAMMTFLINGPNIYQSNAFVNWYINSDNSPVYGDNYLTSQPGQTSNLAGTMGFSTTGANATPQSGNYIANIQSKGTKVCVSLGGYYYDMLASINSVQGAQDFMQTCCHVLLGLGDSTWNKLNWNSAGFVTTSGTRVYFDGLNLDIENIGQGGNPTRPPSQYPLPAGDVPSTGPYPSPKYDYMIDTCQALVTAWGTYGSPSKIFSIAPLSPATTLLTKNTGPTTALGNYQAFPTATSPLSTYSAGSGKGLQAQIHPTQLKFFDQVFIQTYNEDATWSPGGVNFTANLTQWAFLCKKAQDLGGKTKVMLGFATQDSLPPLYDPATWPSLINTALNDTNTALATYYPTIQTSDWCDGMGLWASPSGTTTLISEYARASTTMPLLPSTGATMVWADADYNLSALDPLWDRLPVVRG